MTTFDLFEAQGFLLVPGVLAAEECEAIGDRIVPGAEYGSGGRRSLLDEPWCADLAGRLGGHPALAGLIPSGHVAIQCTYFEKSSARNWLVPIHQDLSVPVAERVEGEGLRGWSEKEGSLFVQGPVDLLEQVVAVRVHLDGCRPEDGPLRVIPGSHRLGRIEPAAVLEAREALPEVACEAPRGSALLMRPLLLHASSKASGGGRRRVLHFVFGPDTPPCGLRWARAIRAASAGAAGAAP
ncbi:Phytanoyl-CoA dioxygenase (PhyH) [Aquisphaera giovannonii]|uniref:Phytanoyl-CoA dioxygenase (PhyH) n=1 Tax=Aquisphaera giovannonii TaxID=406548 RepID=A0A5B9W5N4_9BACT|nr:phytanoyl-CoA dioxygenase family protein [Aquisphaera giovannonii]QEH35913.1 Phytanoyl-CoA dioxygenase (PhyH) [Aquisphaera giovannonii]